MVAVFTLKTLRKTATKKRDDPEIRRSRRVTPRLTARRYFS